MKSNHQTNSMNRELAAASPELVGNGDLLRGVLAGCGDCVKVLDLDGRLQFMSEGGKRVMEVEDFASLKGCPWPDFWEGEGHLQAKAAVATAKAGGIGRFQNHANTAKGSPRYRDVQVSAILGSGGDVEHLLSISRDITAEWKTSEIQRVAIERHAFLVEELTHRVKNTLATVMVMANQTFRGDQYRDLREAFYGRIKTMSDAHNVLSEGSWNSTNIKSVVESALAPYRTGMGEISIHGPDLEIRPTQALTLALALNELATNAAKYGALSTSNGRIAIAWTINPTLKFTWSEIGGPTVGPPTRSGFGSRMIKTMLAGDFGGTVDLRYEPTGMICELDAPIHQ